MRPLLGRGWDKNVRENLASTGAAVLYFGIHLPGGNQKRFPGYRYSSTGTVCLSTFFPAPVWPLPEVWHEIRQTSLLSTNNPSGCATKFTMPIYCAGAYKNTPQGPDCAFCDTIGRRSITNHNACAPLAETRTWITPVRPYPSASHPPGCEITTIRKPTSRCTTKVSLPGRESLSQALWPAARVPKTFNTPRQLGRRARIPPPGERRLPAGAKARDRGRGSCSSRTERKLAQTRDFR
jgi:hypothetical protein